MQETKETAPASQAEPYRPLPQDTLLPMLRRFFIVFLSLWLLSAALVLSRGKFQLKLTDPSLSFWFDDGKDAHMDLAGFNPRTQRFTNRETGQPVVVYPAPMMMVYMALTRWTFSPVKLYGVAVFLIALLLALCFGRLAAMAIARPGLAYSSALAVMTLFYPLWFVFERSNVEAILWLPTALAAVALVLRRYKFAAFLVALAASLKIYPGILMLIFLRKGRYRHLALSLGWYAAFTIVGLWWLNPNLLAAWGEMKEGMATLTRSHLTIYEGKAIGYDHSVFSVVKQTIRLRFPEITRYQPELIKMKVVGAIQIYTLAVPLAFSVVFFTWIRKLPDINEVIVLIIFSVTLPPVSYEYTLLQVLPAFAFLLIYFMQARLRNIPIPLRWRMSVTASFIVISLPLAFIGGSTVGYGGQIKLVALIIPIAFCFSHPIKLVFGRQLMALPSQAATTL